MCDSGWSTYPNEARITARSVVLVPHSSVEFLAIIDLLKLIPEPLHMKFDSCMSIDS